MLITEKSKEQLEKERGYSLSYLTPITTIITNQLLEQYPPSKGMEEYAKPNNFQTWKDIDPNEKIKAIERARENLIQTKRKHRKTLISIYTGNTSSILEDALDVLDRKITFYRENPEKAQQQIIKDFMKGPYRFLYTPYAQELFNTIQEHSLDSNSNLNLFAPIGGVASDLAGVSGDSVGNALIRNARIATKTSSEYDFYSFMFEQNNPFYLVWLNGTTFNKELLKFLELQKIEAIVGLETKVQTMPLDGNFLPKITNFTTNSGYLVRDSKYNPLVSKGYQEYLEDAQKVSKDFKEEIQQLGKKRKERKKEIRKNTINALREMIYPIQEI